MVLTEQESKLFYQLMWSLQHYVNQKLNVIPAIKNLDEYIALDMEKKLPVRDALYADISLIDDYLKDNPQNFPADELAQVKAWKSFVKGQFYIERYLKKYSIFIGPQNKVYAVYGLTEPLSEIIHKSYLPHSVEAVLLPFADKIIYDGLLRSYNVYFGTGISGDLKNTYLMAKGKDEIIESLTATKLKEIVEPKLVKNWQKEMQELGKIAAGLRGGQGQPVMNGPAFSLIKAAIELGGLTTAVPQDIDAIYKAFNRVERAVQKMEKALYYVE